MIAELILTGLWKPRSSHTSSPLGLILLLVILCAWTFSPSVALGLLGKDWLGMKSSEPIDPATFYERKVALIGAALPASALGLLYSYFTIFPRDMDILIFIAAPVFAPVSIFIIGGLGLAAGWLIGRGSQTSR